MNLTIKTDNLKPLQESFAQAPNAVTGSVHRLFRKIGKLLVVTIKEEMPEGATKKLRQYANFTIEGIRDLRLVVYDGRQYGRYVRSGTRPHWVPLDPLIAWVQAKHLAGNYSVKSHRRLGSSMTRWYQDAQTARAIQFKIARKGTKANPYHVRALNARKDDIEAAAREEGVQLVATLAKGK